jgi:phospholipid N-methyltransferase
MRFWAECGAFFREFRQNFRDTGSILPSSVFLARALTSQLRQPRGPARILEVGPGIGSVTRQILKQLGPDDRLELVELNGHFVAHLQRRFDQDPAFRSCRPQVRIIHAAVEDLKGEGLYDFIVSGLPHNNFPGSQVRTIFQVYSRLLRPGGTLTYFEYALLRQLLTPLLGRREKRRLFRVRRVVNRYIHSYQVRRQGVLANVPPAVVRHLRLKPITPAPGQA